MKRIVTVSHRNFIDPRLKVGARVILVENEYIGESNRCTKKGEMRYGFRMINDYPYGIPGVHDEYYGKYEYYENCVFEGWRGATGNWSVTAQGAWEIVSISQSRFNDGDYGKKIRVELSYLNLKDED